jgi:hypothetical protein
MRECASARWITQLRSGIMLRSSCGDVALPFSNTAGSVALPALGPQKTTGWIEEIAGRVEPGSGFAALRGRGVGREDLERLAPGSLETPRISTPTTLFSWSKSSIRPAATSSVRAISCVPVPRSMT